MTAFDLDFSVPVPVETPRGPMLLASAKPNEHFWRAWRFDKTVLIEEGFKVLKVGDAYRVHHYKPNREASPYPVSGPLLPLRNNQRLKPYQVPHTEQMAAAMRKFGYAIDASDAGTGKTYSTYALARELNLRLAVVCPLTVVPAWVKVGKFFGIKPYFVKNYEGCKSDKFPHGVKDENTDDYFWKLSKTKILLVFDEGHKCKGEYSQNAKMMIAAKEQGIPTVVLSATAANSPVDMRALGFTLGLHDLTDFRAWLKGKGCYQRENNSWNCPDENGEMLEIHKHLFPAKGSRMRIADLGDAFPKTQITADTYPIAKAKLQCEQYDFLVNEIKKLRLEKKEGWAAAALTLNLRYRQLTETLKIDLLASLTNDYLENKKSVVIFVNYDFTVDELQKKFKNCSVIRGGQSSKEREENIQLFQKDKSRVMVANVKAGGVGVSLHDLNGRFARVALICPTYSAIDLVQVLGRIHREGSKSTSLQRLIYAEGTIEEEICQTVGRRIDAIAKLNDGDLSAKDIFGILGKEKGYYESL